MLFLYFVVPIIIILLYFKLFSNINNLYSFMVFHPIKENFYDTSYSQTNMPNIIQSKNGKNICYFEYKPSNNKFEKIIIWSHGNAYNSYHSSDFYQCLADNLNVLVVGYDYQGYGLSEGHYSEKNCCDDIECMVAHIMTNYNVDSSKICLIGHSLGTGVVMDYVFKNDWNNTIMLISPYKSIIRVMFPRIGKYLSFMDMFNTIKKLDKIKCPIKILHGKDDELININHSYDIYDELNDKTHEPVWINSCDHDNILMKIDIDTYAKTFCL